MVTDAQFIVSDSSYKLTNASMDQKGLVWSKSTVDLSYDFNLKTQMRFGDDNDGGNGIAFILQNISSVVQSSGTSDLGYTGLSPSVAVEFDTYFNDAT